MIHSRVGAGDTLVVMPSRLAFVLIIALAGCTNERVTNCGDILCPPLKVCNGPSACVYPDQLSSCAGHVDGDPCSYTGDSFVYGECQFSASGLSSICIERRCGNGVTTSDEVCDDGNTVDGDGCSANCQSRETCPNGITDKAVGEECDDGDANSRAQNATCRPGCVAAKCGDEIVDDEAPRFEDCDEGSANSNAPNYVGCRTSCRWSKCGDHIVDDQAPRFEECDLGEGPLGNSNDPDRCRPGCKNPKCGDGIVDTGHGEKCDDGNTAPNDACQGNCQVVCGNMKTEMGGSL